MGVCISFPDPVRTVGLTSKRAYHEPVFARASTTSNCANGTIPACLQELYNIPTTPAKVKSNTLGVTGHFGNNAHYDFLQVSLMVVILWHSP